MVDDETFIRFLELWKKEGVETIDQLIDHLKKYGVNWTWFD